MLMISGMQSVVYTKRWFEPEGLMDRQAREVNLQQTGILVEMLLLLVLTDAKGASLRTRVVYRKCIYLSLD